VCTVAVPGARPAHIYRRLGEVMAEMREAGKLAKRGAGPGRGKVGVPATPTLSETPTLLDQGIDKNLAKQARKDAAMPACAGAQNPYGDAGPT
jgi:hypothetical protein